MTKKVSNLPPEQEAIRARCFHPTGTFAEFTKADVEQSIPERFENIARQSPERVAVNESNRVVTYAELNKAANGLARAILARRSAGNEPVGIFLEFGAPLIIAILGILKAGKIFVIIDPSFPEERINYLLDDSQAILVVGNATTLRVARSYLHKGTQLLDPDELDATSTSDELHLKLSPDSLATLVYTSGSTGRPKGVMQNHRNLLHTVLRDTDAVNFSPYDRLALLRWNSTSGAIVDLFDGLLNGAAVYPYSILKDGFIRLSAWLIREEITIFNSVSSTFRHFLSVLAEERFPRLRLIYIGGEPVNRNDVEL
jgi:non-ribosomal peptide synthetase component F